MREFAGIQCYDRQGEAIPLERWVELSMDRGYKRVAATDVGDYWVSTVWLGLDHGLPWEGHLPLIFETMVFLANGNNHQKWRGELDLTNRYPTETLALAGHDQVVALVKTWPQSSTELDGVPDAPEQGAASRPKERQEG